MWRKCDFVFAFVWTRAYPIYQKSARTTGPNVQKMSVWFLWIHQLKYFRYTNIWWKLTPSLKPFRWLKTHTYVVRFKDSHWDVSTAGRVKKKPHSKLKPIEIDIFKRWIHLKFHWQGTQLMEHMNEFFAHSFFPHFFPRYQLRCKTWSGRKKSRIYFETNFRYFEIEWNAIESNSQDLWTKLDAESKKKNNSINVIRSRTFTCVSTLYVCCTIRCWIIIQLHFKNDKISALESNKAAGDDLCHHIHNNNKIIFFFISLNCLISCFSLFLILCHFSIVASRSTEHFWMSDLIFRTWVINSHIVRFSVFNHMHFN